MLQPTLLKLPLATPFCTERPDLAALFAQHGQELAGCLAEFLSRSPTPQATHDLEQRLADRLRRLGRDLVQWACQRLEPDDPEAMPQRLRYQGELYRRRGRSPQQVATLFGPFTLRRYLYEPLEPGERCLFPVQLQLGLVAGYATPALAQRVGEYAAQQPQRAVLGRLQRDHDVTCSPATLRKVTAALAQGLEPHRQGAQGERLLSLLRRAHKSTGTRRVVLAVGRDGIHVPVMDSGYHEASTATLTVFDRRGRRLGTVYLGRMPEAGQQTLSGQLTALLQEVLGRWDKAPPRLAYITDGGWHPQDYVARVLRRLPDPRHPGRLLEWEQVLDFYHAAQYVTQLAEALFGPTARGRAWAKAMRRRLKERGGVTRLLQAATWHRGGWNLSRARQQSYEEAYRYLRKHRRWMDYARYERAGIPLGSGVTEAGCKVLFTQRLKQSGMKWKAAGGQAIVTPRVLWLSGVWEEVHQAFRASQTPSFEAGSAPQRAPQRKKAA
jgi:hypothetical protein